MRKSEAESRVVNTSEARARWGQILDEVSGRGARVLLARGGSPVAALISVADLELLRQLEEERAQDFVVVDEMRAAFKDVPLEEIEREVERAELEVGHEQRSAARSTAGQGNSSRFRCQRPGVGFG